jgi:superfamily II DNA or RNA helicase
VQDNIYGKVIAPKNILMDLRDQFTFDVPGARFTPKYKMGMWDGKIRVFNVQNCLLYRGLESELKRYCVDRGIDFEGDATPGFIGRDDIDDFVAKQNIPEHFERRDYQLDAMRDGINQNGRALFLSATSSGKSLLIYLLMRWYAKKTLIIVPTITLVHQMTSDFVEYGCAESDIHKITAGLEKWTECPITISTWQSAVDQGQEWFDQFEVVVGDEAHRFAAKSLLSIMDRLKNCAVRLGFTGSLDGSKCHSMVLSGQFGPITKVISTREMIDQGYSSDLSINTVILKHPETVRRMPKMDYQDEVAYLATCEPRNKFICKLTANLEGNTLILFFQIEHGKMLYERLQKMFPDRKVFFIWGDVKGTDRNDARAMVEELDDAIIVASYGTFSTGINIKRLHNIIFASAWKSQITTLQSIGRGLRKGENKEICMVFDLTDDMSWKRKKNHTLLHSFERIKIYNEQQLDYEISNVDLNY